MNTFYQVPIGCLYAAEQLRRQGSEVAFYDLRIDRDTESVYARIAQADLAVVFSADYDMAQCYPSLEPTAVCVRHIKAASSIPVACAGSHATVDAGLTKAFTGADISVAGEFEFALPDLVRFLEAGGSAPGRWPAEGIRVAGEEELRNLGAPAYDLAPMKRYFCEGIVRQELDCVNSGLVLANRGCPYACDFCYLLFGRKLRRRPIEKTLAELELLHEAHAIRHFFFLDYTFTIDNRWVHAICDGIRKLRADLSWLCQTRVDCLDGSTLRAMKEAGCSGIWLGIESPEVEQRRYLSKGMVASQDIEAGISLIRRCGIEVLAFVMVGLPNETELSLVNLNSWLKHSGVYYSLSTFQRRLGTPLVGDRSKEIVQQGGWAYLDQASEFLGASTLRRDRLDWFFEFHANSPTRVANVMRRRLAAGGP